MWISGWNVLVIKFILFVQLFDTSVWEIYLILQFERYFIGEYLHGVFAYKFCLAKCNFRSPQTWKVLFNIVQAHFHHLISIQSIKTKNCIFSIFLENTIVLVAIQGYYEANWSTQSIFGQKKNPHLCASTQQNNRNKSHICNTIQLVTIKPGILQFHALLFLLHFLSTSPISFVATSHQTGLFKQQEFMKSTPTSPSSRAEMYVRRATPDTYREVLRDIRQKEIYKLIVDTSSQHMSKFFRAVNIIISIPNKIIHEPNRTP